MEIRFNGARSPGVTAKDMILGSSPSTARISATGYVLEYTGEAIRALDGRADDGVQYVASRQAHGRD